MAVLPNNRQLTLGEVYGLALMYWPYPDVERAVNICREESGFWTGAWNLENEDSRGLWQINVSEGAHPELKKHELGDPQINAYWAYQIWVQRGWQAWYNSAKRLGYLDS